MIQKLAPESLRRTVDPVSLPFETTEELMAIPGIIGQRRAVSALRFGLNIPNFGFNVYVSGPPGIGKMTAVQAFVAELARDRTTARDWCYVNNFDDPYRPKVLKLDAGQGRALQQDMDRLIDHLREEIPKVFDSEDYSNKRDEIVSRLEEERTGVFNELKARVEAEGFALESTPIGVMLIPVRDGRPLGEEQFKLLPEESQAKLMKQREGLQEELKAAMRTIRDLGRAAHQRLRDLSARIALFVVGGVIDDFAEKYATIPDVLSFLQAVKSDIVEHIDAFRAPPQSEEEGASTLLLARRMREVPYRRYRVNVLVGNGKREGAPVVVELNPTYANLFGRIEKESELGTVVTDFTMLKAGSLHRANGGFLVLPAVDLLREPFAWDGLKRALRSREIALEDLPERLGLVSTRGLKPEPAPLDVKVVLVGRPIYFYLLHAYDEEFPELFKVSADFDTRMDWAEEEVEHFCRFLHQFCTKEAICHLDRAGVARLLEHAARLAEDQTKLSTRLGALSDVVREAHYWALRDKSLVTRVEHVERALEEKVYRSSLIRDRVQEMIERDFVLIDTKGKTVGQVNGLSVIMFGEVAFGRPSRITATATPGRGGIVDIEREVELGGPIHSKGVLILAGYLANRFAAERPLTLAARLVFEQSYEGVEGDSASSAELYALLSALSGVPIDQGIAVTGSVNQRGEVQAIGGANEKIEGFFEICRSRGLTGNQGVLIPRSNLPNLMLRTEVVEAVRAGRFHVWAVDTIDEGIEVLSGVEAGARDGKGRFPAGTINARVESALERYAERMRALAAPTPAGPPTKHRPAT